MITIKLMKLWNLYILYNVIYYNVNQKDLIIDKTISNTDENDKYLGKDKKQCESIAHCGKIDKNSDNLKLQETEV